jgi:hypothetical protein
VTAPKAWEMAATAGEECHPGCSACRWLNETERHDDHKRPGTPEYRAALRAVETKAYRWLLARLGLR